MVMINRGDIDSEENKVSEGFTGLGTGFCYSNPKVLQIIPKISEKHAIKSGDSKNNIPLK